jgi:antirestriction protein ArdC
VIFLSADLALTPEIRDDHAAYISSWIKVLKDDKRAIFTAASHAQRAVDFLRNFPRAYACKTVLSMIPNRWSNKLRESAC